MWLLCQRHMVVRYLLVSTIVFLCSTIALTVFFFFFITDIARSEHVRWIVTIVVYNHVLRIEESGLRQVSPILRSIDYLKRCAGDSTHLRDILIIPGAGPTFSLLSTQNLRLISRLLLYFFYFLLLSFTIYYVIVIVNFTHYIVTHYRLLSLLLCCFNYGNEKNVVRAATTMVLYVRVSLYVCVCMRVLCLVLFCVCTHNVYTILFYVCTHNVFIEDNVLRCDPGRVSPLFASIKYFRNRANIHIIINSFFLSLSLSLSRSLAFILSLSLFLSYGVYPKIFRNSEIW